MLVRPSPLFKTIAHTTRLWIWLNGSLMTPVLYYIGRRKSSGSQYQQYTSPVNYQQPQISASSNQPQIFNPRRASATPPATANPYPNIFNPANATVPEAAPVGPGPLPPSATGQHVPDIGGPGHVPPVSSGPGWNDPPPMTMSKPKAKPATVPATLDPITQPLFGAVPQNEPPPLTTPGMNQQYGYGMNTGDGYG